MKGRRCYGRQDWHAKGRINTTFHKRQDMIKTGIILEFLPLYSPDLIPIEKKWVQAKSIRKKLRCADIDSLFQEYFDYVA
ncbi:hypothetical protein QJU83_05565 [Pasteurella skyensis]|uniref:hypothetical protein n=1 Tax=Phocoenobacter skyensis TaxID=97481 RepID=UPI00275AD028|nr:hypothetical protein [Pasteurella skyensis]MDP8177012.1 hypothetical protein [Pasteurella skyensis]MDP8199614.1 hypothetical protein [Pasteurella skyensis]